MRQRMDLLDEKHAVAAATLAQQIAALARRIDQFTSKVSTVERSIAQDLCCTYYAAAALRSCYCPSVLL